MKLEPPKPSQTYERDFSLRRVLGFWPAVSIVIGTAIGSGIFLVPSDMVKAVGSPGMVFAVWIFGGVLDPFWRSHLCRAIGRAAGAGGEYVYLNAAYGPFFGFVYGWTQTWVAKSASIATLATGFYTYLADFLPGLNRAVWLTSIIRSVQEEDRLRYVTGSCLQLV